MTDLVPLVAPPHLSPSSIGTFKQCPLRYKYSRIDNLPEPPTEASILGNFVHDIAENLYNEPSENRTELRAKQIASEVWSLYEDRVAAVLQGSAEKIRMFRWNAWWCVENLFKMEDPQALSFEGLESELNHTLFADSDTPVAIKGFIDRWNYEDGEIVIGDYKTGKVPGVRYREDKFFQLLLYGLVLQEQLKKPIKRIELLYIKNAELLQHIPTDEDIVRVSEDIKATRRAIDERCITHEFEHKRGRLCDWCNFKPICPAWRTK